VSATVLIAAPEHLALLKERSDLAGALAFPDTDALQALDTITRQRPSVVALERLFAGTSRGAAFINRIKADPALASCEIRIVAHDSTYSRVSTRKPGEAAPAAAPAAVAEPPRGPAPVAEPPRGPAPLDQRGTRRAPRFKVVENVEVVVDGNPATLIDVSTVGAQVLSATTLRPNQRLRMALPDATRPIRFNAGVAWAAFEMPKGGPRYRAGIEFYDAESEVLRRFIEANKK
jgi:hypothetical protein